MKAEKYVSLEGQVSTTRRLIKNVLYNSSKPGHIGGKFALKNENKRNLNDSEKFILPEQPFFFF